MLKLFALTVPFIVMTVPAPTQENALNGQADRASEVWEGERSLFAHLIGLRETMTAIIDRTAALAAGIPDLPPELVTAWSNAVHDVYDPDKMIPDATLLFAQNMTREAEEEIIAFFQTPLGEKLGNARQEMREGAPESFDVLLARERALAQSDPRLHGLYFDLGAAIQGDPDFAETLLVLRVLMGSTYGEEAAEQYAAAFAETARSSLPNTRTIYAMQLLPEASESEIETILAFYHSPSGQQLAHVEAIMVFAVLEAGIEELSANLTDRLTGQAS